MLDGSTPDDDGHGGALEREGADAIKGEAVCRNHDRGVGVGRQQVCNLQQRTN